jgi:hypothetical protein
MRGKGNSRIKRINCVHAILFAYSRAIGILDCEWFQLSEERTVFLVRKFMQAIEEEKKIFP